MANAIVELGAVASLRAVQNGRQLARETAEARAEWNTKLRSVRSDSVVWKIVDTLIERPVLDADSVAQQHSVTTTAARTAINRMVEAGVLNQANDGLRFRNWIATDVATVLDRFGERTGRRNTACPEPFEPTLPDDTVPCSGEKPTAPRRFISSLDLFSSDDRDHRRRCSNPGAGRRSPPIP